jgi:hypothetical protein
MNKPLRTPRKTKRIDSDTVLKELFQAAGPLLWHALLKRGVKGFLNIEFTTTKSHRADLLVEEEDDTLTHLEFQSSNDPKCRGASWNTTC